MDIKLAAKRLNGFDKLLPEKEIEYLRSVDTSPEILDEITFAFTYGYDDIFFYDEDKESWSMAPLSWAIVAEKHLDLALVPAMVGSLVSIDWDYFQEQIEILSVLMAKKFGNEYVSLVLQEIEKWQDDPDIESEAFLFLFEMFEYVDCEEHRAWIENYLLDHKSKWRDSLVGNGGLCKMKNYKDILDKLYIEAIEGHVFSISFPEIEYAYSIVEGKRIREPQELGKNPWKERFRRLLVDEEEIKQEALASKEVLAKISESNQILSTLFNGKIGRNDPCTCMSGKKYKKCCAKLSGDVRALVEQNKLSFIDLEYVYTNEEVADLEVYIFLYYSRRTFEYIVVVFEFSERELAYFGSRSFSSGISLIESVHRERYPSHTLVGADYASARREVLKSVDLKKLGDELKGLLSILDYNRPF